MPFKLVLKSNSFVLVRKDIFILLFGFLMVYIILITVNNDLTKCFLRVSL